MTISVLQERSANNAATGATSLGLAFSSSMTAGSSIHGFGTQADTASPTLTMSDTANGSYPAALDTKDDTSGGALQMMAQFKFDNSAAGANTVTVSSTQNNGFLGIWIREIGGTSGYDSSHAANLQTAPGTGADAVTSTNCTPSTQPGLISALSFDTIAGGIPVLGTGFTTGASGWSFSGNNALSESKRYTSTSALSATYTATAIGTDNFITMAAIFKETVAGDTLSGQVCL